MRRRTLLGGSSVEYVFSAQSTSVSVNYTSSSRTVSIKSTANGSNIGYSVVSYDGTVVTGVTTAATYVYIYYSSNSTYYERSGNVVLKQNDSNKTITINVSQAAKSLVIDYEGVLLDGTSGSYGSSGVNGEVTISDVPSWATVTYSSGKINVTASSTNSASTARLEQVLVRAGRQTRSLRIIQLPSDYHSRSYITMGGLNWAIKNVGASSVKDYGNYYMYGKGSRTYNASDSIYEGMETPLASTADTATVVMGSGWRMPTQSELEDLENAIFANRYFASYNGVNGFVCLDSDSGGNVLFFPAGGDYFNGSNSNIGNDCWIWSSTPYDSERAHLIRLYKSSSTYVDYVLRKIGCSVRGVQA